MRTAGWRHEAGVGEKAGAPWKRLTWLLWRLAPNLGGNLSTEPVPREPANSNPAVFICYAHEGDLGERVHNLALWLRQHDVLVHTDHHYANRPPEEGWRAWMQRHVEDDDVVMVVCTERYKQLFEKRPVEGGRGFGVTWEGAIITAELYNARLRNSRFYPILPDDGDPCHVPTVLLDWFNGHRFPSENRRILALIRDETPAVLVDRQPPPLVQDQTTSSALSRENPFGDRGCIRDPARFFNREWELAEIFDELRKGSSLSLVGEAQAQDSPPGQHAILRALAAASADQGRLANLTGLSPHTLEPALTTLEAHDVITLAADTTYCFTVELMRRWVGRR